MVSLGSPGRAVIALVRYQLADLAGSQRWVAPLLAYLCFLGFVYASDPGPAVPAFGVTSLALLPVSAWLTRQLFGVEDDTARLVTAAAARGPVRVQAALLCSAVLGQLPLAALAVAWAFVGNHEQVRTASPLLGGLVVHLVFAVGGVGLGAAVARPLLRPPGPAALALVTAFVVSILVEWSPVLRASRALQTDPVHHFRQQLFPWLAGLLALAAVGAGLSLMAARRE
jgi:hypothetical protein